MKKYLIVAIFLAARNEILSLITLCVMLAMFIWDMGNWVGKEKW